MHNIQSVTEQLNAFNRFLHVHRPRFTQLIGRLRDFCTPIFVVFDCSSRQPVGRIPGPSSVDGVLRGNSGQRKSTYGRIAAA